MVMLSTDVTCRLDLNQAGSEETATRMLVFFTWHGGRRSTVALFGLARNVDFFTYSWTVLAPWVTRAGIASELRLACESHLVKFFATPRAEPKAR